MLKSSWFIGCFAETTNDETDLATHLSLVCNALSLLRAVVQSADVLQQLCPSASCKIATILELGDYLFSSNKKTSNMSGMMVSLLRHDEIGCSHG